jgi:hypothetical protein
MTTPPTPAWVTVVNQTLDWFHTEVMAPGQEYPTPEQFLLYCDELGRRLASDTPK